MDFARLFTRQHTMPFVSGDITHCCRVSLASVVSLSTSAELRRGLMARASSGGNSSSSISISGWSRGTSMEALGLRLARRGRSALDLRSSVSDTQTDDDDEDEDIAESWAGLGLLTGGIAGTGSDALSMQVALAMGRYFEGRSDRRVERSEER